ncbi:bifunctional adenosylcobinamide kinase/adenosylcobinamide-phosphate guanylyltransferase, partial [Listeria monocytogenes]
GLGVVPENKLTRVFRDIIGRVNQQIATQVEEVYLVVSGIPKRWK